MYIEFQAQCTASQYFNYPASQMRTQTKFWQYSIKWLVDDFNLQIWTSFCGLRASLKSITVYYFDLNNFQLDLFVIMSDIFYIRRPVNLFRAFCITQNLFTILLEVFYIIWNLNYIMWNLNCVLYLYLY